METEERGVVFPAWEALPDLGLYMDQVVTLMDRQFTPALPKGEMTKSMVNNYVKAGLLPRPAGKKYEREHIALLLMIFLLKQALNMDSIGRLLRGLCRKGVQDGYARFCAVLEMLEAAVRQGHIALDLSRESAEDQALHAAIMASLCTIYTYRIQGAGEKEGTR